MLKTLLDTYKKTILSDDEATRKQVTKLKEYNLAIDFRQSLSLYMLLQYLVAGEVK
jgi:hypothetical protein